MRKRTRRAAGPVTRSSSPRAKRHGLRLGWRLLGGLSLAALVLLGGYFVYVDRLVVTHLGGTPWQLSASVYGRSLEIYEGRLLTPERLARELDLLGYRKIRPANQPGRYAIAPSRVELTTRAFRFPDRQEPSRSVVVYFDGDRVSDVALASGSSLNRLRLDPPLIGTLLPKSGEDRMIITRDEAPPLLIDALLLVEDRRFYAHHGIDVRGVLRAVWKNARARRIVEGGSTLTQQLVRSYFLNNRRSFARKLHEAILALAVERRYDKETVLNAYLNEVYLGQDGKRAIHGFALASYFYFDKPIEELDTPEVALLVGMVKGPSVYDPRRHAEAAKERRDVVLDILLKNAVLDSATVTRAKSGPIGQKSTAAPRTRFQRAFVDVVRRDLASDFDEDVLTTEGVRVFTTLDPFVQAEAEAALSRGLTDLEKAHGFPAGSLEGAVVVTSTGNGDVLAVVGDRDPSAQGFNRAVNAKRPIGSLAKPAIYLLALETEKYTLASTLLDSALAMREKNGTVWRPQNFDKLCIGRLPMFRALMDSRNLPTIRLGLDLGLDSVIETFQRLGLQAQMSPYPSILLGAISVSPLEVAEMYTTLATGTRTRARVVKDVIAASGTRLGRYPAEAEPAFSREEIYQLGRTLQEATHAGTAKSLRSILPEGLEVAGKTGTTDDLRDSWFAGFSGDRVAVVWVGRDDNSPVGLTGASGALRIWGRLMRGIAQEPYAPRTPPGIDELWVDVATGNLSCDYCEGAVRLPFPSGRGPWPGGESPTMNRAFRWFRNLFR